MRERVQPKRPPTQGDVEGGLVTILSRPVRLKGGREGGISEAKPQKSVIPKRDEGVTPPQLGDQGGHQGGEAALDADAPGLVVYRLKRYGVRPKHTLADRDRGAIVDTRPAVRGAMERITHEATAAPDEGLILKDLVPAWITAEEAERRV